VETSRDTDPCLNIVKVRPALVWGRQECGHCITYSSTGTVDCCCRSNRCCHLPSIIGTASCLQHQRQLLMLLDMLGNRLPMLLHCLQYLEIKAVCVRGESPALELLIWHDWMLVACSPLNGIVWLTKPRSGARPDKLMTSIFCLSIALVRLQGHLCGATMSLATVRQCPRITISTFYLHTRAVRLLCTAPEN